MLLSGNGYYSRMSLDVDFDFQCPLCRAEGKFVGREEWRCDNDHTFECISGIWRFLVEESEAFFSQFIREYEIVRETEGYGSSDPHHYQKLPFIEENDYWEWRTQSFNELLYLLRDKRLDILDMGAGNSWMTYQLSKRGHHVAAIDLTTNVFDGLGAHRMYDQPLLTVQAEFDRLPFDEYEADMVIFNSSFHYSINYERTMREAVRVLRSKGEIVIMDTPVYQLRASGEKQVKAREARFVEKYGFPSDAIPMENFLTFERVEQLGRRFGIHWHLHWPHSRFKSEINRMKAQLLGQDEPAQYPLLVGELMREERD